MVYVQIHYRQGTLVQAYIKISIKQVMKIRQDFY